MTVVRGIIIKTPETFSKLNFLLIFTSLQTRGFIPFTEILFIIEVKMNCINVSTNFNKTEGKVLTVSREIPL